MPRPAAGAPEPPADHITSIADGRLDATTICALRAAEHGKHLLLVEGLRRSAQISSTPFERAVIAKAHRLLLAIERHSPAIVTDTLTLPQVGGWTAAHLVGQASGVPGPGYLAALAAAAAYRADVPFDLLVPTRDGVIRLPGLGDLTVAGQQNAPWVRLRSDSRKRLIAGEEARTAPAGQDWKHRWTPIPRLQVATSDLELDVLLDTDDNLTARFGARPRLGPSADAIWRWQELLSGAWRILVQRHRRTASALSAGLRTLVPLPASDETSPISATSGWLWGAIGMRLPPDPLTFAEVLVHEFHHLLLAAIEDLTPLITGEGAPVLYAPWRDDPRPISGLLHGAYANIALAGFWRTEAQRRDGTDPAEPLRSEVEYVWRLGATPRVVREIRRSGTLTEHGLEFVRVLEARLRRMHAQQVSATALRLARELTDEHRLRWRLAHRVPDDALIETLARAWAAGTLRTPLAPARWPQATIDPKPRLPTQRHRLLVLRSRAPAAFAEQLAADTLPGADRALLIGDDETARTAYLARISAAGDPDAWLGLALVTRRPPGVQDLWLLSWHPDVVYAVHERIRSMTKEPPDALELIRWLAGAERTGP